jgi:excisionase family DNA binding protein
MKKTYTVKQTAEWFGAHPETIRRAIRSGELKAVRVGRSYRITGYDLEAFWRSKGGGRLFDLEDEGE